MALINIVKGMAGGAEAIQANFAAIGEMTTGTNANGTYTRWPNGFTIAQKKSHSATKQVIQVGNGSRLALVLYLLLLSVVHLLSQLNFMTVKVALMPIN